MSRLLIIVLLAVSACGGSGGGGPPPPAAEPLFADVAAAFQLVFINQIGPTFPGASVLNMQHMQRNMGNGAAVADYDGDGDLDIYLLGHNGTANRLFRNDHPQKSFTDVTPALLADTGLSRVAHFADLDNDGDLDLLLINDDDGTAQMEPSRIFQNDNGTWVDATPGSGFRPVGFLKCGCALADYDGDGLLDIYVTNWGYCLASGAPAFPGANQLYRNKGGLVFEDVTAAVKLDGLERDSFTAIFHDFDDDFDPDLYVAVDHTSDEFFFNDGTDFRSEGGSVGVTHTGNDMGVACADLDDDGDLDMYVTNITDTSGQTGTTQGNVLYINQQDVTGTPLFVDEAAMRGCFDSYFGWGTEFLDVENDGDLDLVAANGFDEWVLTNKGPSSPILETPTVLFVNDGTGHFSRRTGAGLDDPNDGRALIAFDFDRDGDLDLLTTTIGQPVVLLENRSTLQGHWLGVELKPCHMAIGARVFATIGAVTKRRDVIAGHSYLAGTPTEVHFGLGGATQVDSLRIVWADGTSQTLTNVPADQLLRISAP